MAAFWRFYLLPKLSGFGTVIGNIVYPLCSERFFHRSNGYWEKIFHPDYRNRSDHYQSIHGPLVWRHSVCTGISNRCHRSGRCSTTFKTLWRESDNIYCRCLCLWSCITINLCGSYSSYLWYGPAHMGYCCLNSCAINTLCDRRIIRLSDRS